MGPTVTLIVERDPESGWYVGHIAELPGCHTQAETIPALRENALEALRAYLAACEEDEGPLPEFVGLERIQVPA